jgi:hypothetical protein
MNMKARYLITGTVMLGVFSALVSQADNIVNFSSRQSASQNPQYNEECGSCHFAYQPWLLPRRSWQAIMSKQGLQQHFGGNIEFVDSSVENGIRAFLLENSAETYRHEDARKILRSIPQNETPIRISQTPYFYHQHGNIPMRFIKQDAVGSIANCNNCHTRADVGNYDDDFINIPGVGRWDDD